ncbi:MAG: energy transducer TonB [Sphingomicrobium sp.]
MRARWMLAGLISWGAFASAAEPAAPTKWTVDYADDHCEASRSVEIDGKPVLFAIKPPLDGGTTRLLIQKIVRQQRVAEPLVSLDFGDGRPAYRTTMHMVLYGKGLAMIIDLPPAEAQRLRLASVLKIKASSKVAAAFAMTPAAPLFRALDRCVADLQARIGLDSGPMRWTVAATPTTALKPLFSVAKFWTVEMRSPKTSKVSVRLLVDKAGAVRDCVTTVGSGSVGLDIETCQVFQRMVKYRPARAADGQPVASMVNETIDWRL